MVTSKSGANLGLIFVSAAIVLQVALVGALDLTNEANGNPAQQDNEAPTSCSRQSTVLARQMLANELEAINLYQFIGFHDLDKDELLDVQRESLARTIMSGTNEMLLEDGKTLFDIEASYFRPASTRPIPSLSSSSRSITEMFSNHINLSSQGSQQPKQQAFTLKLLKRHPEKCYLSKGRYVYVFGLSLGPLEHNLDVVYNMPKELRLSQPIGWKYAQIKMLVPRMNYEISIRQSATYKLGDLECPLEIADVTYLGTGPQQGSGSRSQQIVLVASGVSENNQTNKQLEQMFMDYTRPTISNRLRHVLKFHFSSKTLPLSVN